MNYDIRYYAVTNMRQFIPKYTPAIAYPGLISQATYDMTHRS